MPGFTLKDAMLGMALVAVGLTLEILYFRYGRILELGILADFYCFFGGAAAIGAGLLAPFHEKAPGVLIGLGLAVCYLVFLFARALIF
jgi:hypothetical protein